MLSEISTQTSSVPHADSSMSKNIRESGQGTQSRSTAHLLVQCLENEDVEYVFGIPGEENIRFIDALKDSKIRFILVRHEQGASFMADMYGRVTGRPGVCAATLGPGAINLLLGTADAYTNSTPLVAISAQVGTNRVHKETHQIIDLLTMFKPITKWAETAVSPAYSSRLDHISY
jgi:acetolactate synthase I/II/III large subunit